MGDGISEGLKRRDIVTFPGHWWEGTKVQEGRREARKPVRLLYGEESNLNLGRYGKRGECEKKKSVIGWWIRSRIRSG